MKVLWIILPLLFVFTIAFLAYYFAKRKELLCRNCNSGNVKQTGNKKRFARSKGSPMPYIKYEYECKDCGYKFWSYIENVLKFDEDVNEI